MGRQDSSKGVNNHKPPKKQQAPIDTFRRKLGKQEFSGKSKRDTLKTKEKSVAKKSAMGVKDIVLVMLAGGALLGAVYFMMYISINMSLDDN